MKKVLVFTVLFFAFGCKSNSEKKVLELTKKCQDYLLKNDVNSALKVLTEIEKIDSNFKGLHDTKARYYLVLNKPEQAKIEINKQLKKDSLNAEVWITNGIISRELKDVKYSNFCFKKSINFFKSGKSNFADDSRNIDMMVFHLYYIVNDSESKIENSKIKSKWKVDYKMMDYFKFIESETPEKALDMLYK